MMKDYLTESEFDRLPDEVQIHYKYCIICGLFYLGRLCSHGN